MAGGARLPPERSLKERAIQLLAQREHSRVELRRKLLPHAMAGVVQARAAAGEDDDPDSTADSRTGRATADVQAQLDALLDWLEANRHLSPQRFVESRVHARASRFGNLRIHQELARHQLGLPTELESALRGTELDRARAVWAARFSGGPADVAERGKQARFLAGRGFSGEVIQRVLREAGQRKAGRGGTASDAD